jgi:hypothetical protein
VEETASSQAEDESNEIEIVSSPTDDALSLLDEIIEQVTSGDKTEE